jgi:MFS family permease
MVGVMGVTPAALHHLGHGDTAIAWIISVHIGGMFALSPLIGAAMDRWGRRAGLVAGCGASVAGALLAGSEGPSPVVGAGLFLLGIGWSATFLGATAVISDVTRPAERAGALGFTDLVVSTCSATAGLASAALLETAGYRVLGVATAALVVVAMTAVVRMRPATRDAAIVSATGD